MKITKKFKIDLNRCYMSEISFNRLIQENEKTIKQVGYYYYNKYKNCLHMNDEDDLFQIACFWLVDAFWKFDPTKNISLERYVIYNIGARIQAEIKKERVNKRGGNKIKVELKPSVMNKIPNYFSPFSFENNIIKLIDVKNAV